MDRRMAILSFTSLCLLPCASAGVVGPQTPDHDSMRAANDFALVELNAIRAQYPGDWRDLSYIESFFLNDDHSLMLCVTRNPKLIDLWAARVENAMNKFGLLVYGIGQAGKLPGLRHSHNVTTLIVGSKSLIEAGSCFADLKDMHKLQAIQPA